MKILISVITLNEEQNIEKTLRDLQDNNFGFDILVVDNGSQDKTLEVCKKMQVPYISHCINSGSAFGNVRSYFLYAFHNHYDVVCQFDGDGQHTASELNKIIEPINQNHADLVIGSRFIERKGFQSSKIRRVGIKLFSAINSMIIGQKITDTTSGFKAYNWTLIDFFSRRYRNEIFDINQLLLLCHYAGARIKEVPVVMKHREHGTSEFNMINSILFPVKGLINILGCVLQGKL